MAARPGVVGRWPSPLSDRSRGGSCWRDGGQRLRRRAGGGLRRLGGRAHVHQPRCGGGFLLARTRRRRRDVLFDFFADTPGRGLCRGRMLEPHFVPMTVHFPASDQVFNIGLGSVAVPGSLAGLPPLYIDKPGPSLSPIRHHRARRAPWRATAIVLNEHQAYVIGLLEPDQYPHAGRCRALYAKQGRDRSPRVGERLANPDLAELSSRISSGAASTPSTRGDLAAAHRPDDMRRGTGGSWSRRPTSGGLSRPGARASGLRPTGALRVLTNPPPSFGGSLIALSCCELLETLAARAIRVRLVGTCWPGSAFRHAGSGGAARPCAPE